MKTQPVGKTVRKDPVRSIGDKGRAMAEAGAQPFQARERRFTAIRYDDPSWRAVRMTNSIHVMFLFVLASKISPSLPGDFPINPLRRRAGSTFRRAAAQQSAAASSEGSRPSGGRSKAPNRQSAPNSSPLRHRMRRRRQTKFKRSRGSQGRFSVALFAVRFAPLSAHRTARAAQSHASSALSNPTPSGTTVGRGTKRRLDITLLQLALSWCCIFYGGQTHDKIALFFRQPAFGVFYRLYEN